MNNYIRKTLSAFLCLLLLYGLGMPQIAKALWPVGAVLNIVDSTDDVLNLDWTPSENATGYNIYINNELVQTVGAAVYGVDLTKSALETNFGLDFSQTYTVDIRPVLDEVEQLTSLSVVQFTDPGLEAAILQALTTLELDAVLSTINLSQITELIAPSRGIYDLTGLEHLTNLQKLDLTNNELDDEDVAVIAHLTKLTDLNLSHNQISNITFLEHMEEVTKLNLSGNIITDLASLLPYANLYVPEPRRQVDVSFNPLDLQFNDEQELGVYTTLTSRLALKFSTAYVIKSYDTSVVLEMSEYTGALQFQGYQIIVNDELKATTMNPVFELMGLAPGTSYKIEVDALFTGGDPKRLSAPVFESTHPVVMAHIPDVALASAIKDQLGMSGSEEPLTNIDLLRLTTLSASNRGIRDLTGLHGAHYLEHLDVSDNEIYDLSPLKYRQLSTLDVSYNHLLQLDLYEGMDSSSSNSVIDHWAPGGSINVEGNFLGADALAELQLLINQSNQQFEVVGEDVQNTDPLLWPETSSLSFNENDITSSSLTLNWSPFPDTQGITYKIFLNGTEYGTSTTETSLTLTGLVPNKHYAIKVEASDGASLISKTGPYLYVTTPHITEIGLELGEVWLDKGEQASKEMGPYVNGDLGSGALQWSTGDESIATVDPDGTLTAVAPGVTTVRVALYNQPWVYAEATVKVGSILTVAWAENSWFKGSLEGFEIAVRDAESEYSIGWGWTNADGQAIFPYMSPGSYVFELSNNSDAPIEVISSSNGWAYIEQGSTHSDTLYMMPLKAEPMSEDPFSILDVFHHLETGLEDYDFSDVIDRYDLQKLLEQLPPEVEIMRPA